MGLTKAERDLLRSEFALPRVDLAHDQVHVQQVLDWLSHRTSCCAMELRDATGPLLTEFRREGADPRRIVAAFKWLNRRRPRELDPYVAEVIRLGLASADAHGPKPSRAVSPAGSTDLADKLVAGLRAAWPAVEDLVFDDGEHSYTLTRGALANIALCCPTARGSASEHLLVVVPSVGPLPVFASLALLVGEMTERHRSGGSCPGWPPGTPVLIDGEPTTFRGSEGELLAFGANGSRKIAANQCGRVYPGSRDSAARRVVIDQVSSSLGLLAPFHFEHLSKSILLITPKTRSDAIMSQALCGQRISDAFPVAALDREGRLAPASRRFGQLDARLRLASDTIRARLHLEQLERTSPSLRAVVVDAGTASGHTAHLDGIAAFCDQLRRMAIPCFVFADEPALPVVGGLTEAGYLAWEWASDDFTWVEASAPEHGPPDLRPPPVTSRALGAVTVHEVLSGSAAAAHDAYTRLRGLVRARGEDCPAELLEALAEIRSVLLDSIRIASPYPQSEPAIERLRERLSDVTRRRPINLSSEESVASDQTVRSIERYLADITAENPKAATFAQLVNDLPTLIRVDFRVTGSVAAGVVSRTVGTSAAPLAVTSWTWSAPMQKLVRGRGSTPIHLILYPFEHASFRSWESEQKRARTGLRLESSRRKVVPSAPEYRSDGTTQTPAPLMGAPARDPAEERAIEELVQRRLTKRYESSGKHSGAELVSARLVRFEDGFHALLTDGFVANVLIPDQNRVERRRVPEIDTGDLLIFYRGGDRDVIRDLADRVLDKGTREAAELWWMALQRFAAERRLTHVALQELLAENGCVRGEETIRNWVAGNTIGPRDDKDIETIAHVTGDRQLAPRVHECQKATGDVRAAHLRVGGDLAARAREVATRTHVAGASGSLDLGGGVRAVEVISVYSAPMTVERSECNRLLEA